MGWTTELLYGLFPLIVMAGADPMSLRQQALRLLLDAPLYASYLAAAVVAGTAAGTDEIILERRSQQERRSMQSAAVATDYISLLQCAVGNPYRPVAFAPAWRTPTVLALAEGVYADRAFDRLPVLADALADAGCDGVPLLAHLRSPGPHARGCWPVDLVLGKG